jgi:hypothetical protein
MEILRNNIKPVTFLAPVALDEDNSPITSSIIDTKEVAAEDGSPSFDGALVKALVGVFGANLTSVKVKIHESANSNGSSSTLAEGGDEVTFTEAGVANFQIRRTKRYLLAIVTMAATGAGDTAPVAIVGILNNWAKPFPIVA